jgi:hypothetical protein
MGFGFRKSIRIAPGVRLNVSHKGVGASVGVKGLRYSASTRGSRITASIPGTGLYYTQNLSSKRSYTNNAHQKRQELLRQQREIDRLAELERAKHEVEMFENQVQMIKSIHKECDMEFHWQELRNSPAPFRKGEMGPSEQAARQQLAEYKPGLFGRMFGSDTKKRQELEDKIREATNEDLVEYSRWENLVQTAEGVLAGDLDVYLEVVQELAPLDDLSDFGSGFEIYFNTPKIGEVDFDVHPETVIPLEEKSLTPTGKVKTKQMTKTAYFDLYQDYVCSCALRIARDMFAILPLEEVIVHAYEEQLSTRTGHQERGVILSVKIDKRTLNTLNFDRIDCSDSMQNFVHNMTFKKTKGFVTVNKIDS